MRAYNENFSPLRQTAKQRMSSMIAEAKFSKRNPIQETVRVYHKPYRSSDFTQQMRMNRYLMNSASFTNANNIQDYTSTMHEIKRAAQLFPFRNYQPIKKEENMKVIQEHSIKMNLNFLKDVNKNVEKAMSVMALVSTLGRADLYEDRDELTNTLQTLNSVARNVSEAINRMKQ